MLYIMHCTVGVLLSVFDLLVVVFVYAGIEIQLQQ